MDPRPARFLFPVALLPVPALRQTPYFQSEYPRGQLPWTDSPEIASGGRVIPVDLDWATSSGRAIFASGGSKGATPGAEATIGLLVGATKPSFCVGKARTLTVNIPNYTENWKLRLT